MKSQIIYDCIVIGGGVVGAAVLDAVTNLGYKSLLIEKEDDVASGASRANSGIVHAGYDAVENTKKAYFNVLGNKMMPRLAKELDVPFHKIGSLVLAKEGGEKALNTLYQRGIKNGVDVKIINRNEIDALQTGIQKDIVSALYAKDAGIISPYKLTIALCDRAILNGARVSLNEKVSGLSYDGSYFMVTTEKNIYKSLYVVNSAGAYASYINSLIGEETYNTEYKKGEYYVIDKTEGDKLNIVLFPLPDERGKGILVSPTADGNVIYGPTSVLCECDDTTCTAEGLNLVKKGVSAVYEDYNFKKVIREYAGVRASVGDDFIIEQSKKFKGYFILAGICSPGLTSAPAIGKYIADELSKLKSVEKPKHLVTELHHKRLKDLSETELNKLVKKDSRWGRIICRCEKVTEAEIVDAIHSPLPATTVDAVKRRVRAGMGRCQGGFCAPRVIGILARELNIPITAVKKGGEGSELVKSEIKEARND